MIFWLTGYLLTIFFRKNFCFSFICFLSFLAFLTWALRQSFLFFLCAFKIIIFKIRISPFFFLFFTSQLIISFSFVSFSHFHCSIILLVLTCSPFFFNLIYIFICLYNCLAIYSRLFISKFSFLFTYQLIYPFSIYSYLPSSYIYFISNKRKMIKLGNKTGNRTRSESTWINNEDEDGWAKHNRIKRTHKQLRKYKKG